MLDRRVLRWASLMGVIGAVVSIVLRIPGFIHHTSHHPKGRMAHIDAHLVDELETLAGNAAWIFQRYLDALTLGLLLLGVIAVAMSFREEPARSWARLAIPAVVVGVGVAGLSIAMNVALERHADLWAQDPTDVTFAAAEATSVMGGVIYAGMIAALFGFAAILLGVMTLNGGQDPRWLGWLAVVGGVVGLVAATLMHIEVKNNVVSGVLPNVSRLALYLWLLMTAWTRWKAGQAPAAAATTP